MFSSPLVPVEFLHGLGQEPAAWDGVIELMPEWADCSAPTIPSLTAPAREPFSLDVAARWVAADLIDRSEEDGIVVGLSLGSLIAVRLAALEPGLVRGLVLSAPLARAPRMLMRMQRALMGVLPNRALSGPSVAEGGAGVTKANLLEVLDEVSTVDLRHDLAQLECPVLVLVGGNDRANRRSAAEVAEIIPNSSLQVIPGVGHEWNVTHPERFTSAISTWALSHDLD